MEVGRPTVDPEGVVAFHALDHAAGHDDAYRVRFGTAPASVETHLPVRPGDAPVIHAIAPNPSHGGFDVRFTLSGREPTGLAVFDLQGRRRWSREVGEFGPGTHRVHTMTERPLEPGIYFVRLETLSTLRTRKVAVVR